MDNYTLLLHQGLIENAYFTEIENVSAFYVAIISQAHTFLQRRELLRLKRPDAVAAPPGAGGVFRNLKIESCRSLPPSHDSLAATHPCEVTVQHTVTGTKSTVRSKYLLGLDGARSTVRRWVSGGTEGDGEWKGAIRMEGEATDIVWGVIDANVTTNFRTHLFCTIIKCQLADPSALADIKFKCLIHSKDAGSIMIIPREVCSASLD